MTTATSALRGTRRQHVTASLIALPAVLCAVVLVRTVWHRIDPVQLTPIASPEALLEAVASGDLGRAYLLIRVGQDPNELLPFEHRRLTDGETVMVTPLAVAVARRDDNMVRMMLTYGVDFEDPLTQLALCLAVQTDDPSDFEPWIEVDAIGSNDAAICPGWTSQPLFMPMTSAADN